MKDEKNQVAWNNTVPKEPEMGTNMNINQLFHKPLILESFCNNFTVQKKLNLLILQESKIAAICLSNYTVK